MFNALYFNVKLIPESYINFFIIEKTKYHLKNFFLQNCITECLDFQTLFKGVLIQECKRARVYVFSWFFQYQTSGRPGKHLWVS